MLGIPNPSSIFLTCLSHLEDVFKDVTTQFPRKLEKEFKEWLKNMHNKFDQDTSFADLDVELTARIANCVPGQTPKVLVFKQVRCWCDGAAYSVGESGRRAGGV